MRKANKVEKTTDKNHSKNKNYNPDPVKIAWGRNVKDPATYLPEDYNF